MYFANTAPFPARLECAPDSGLRSTQESEATTETRAAVLELPSGRRIRAEHGDDGDQLTVRNAEGEIELAITLTDAGPVLRMQAARLDIQSQQVAIDCDHFRVRARESISHETGGDLHEVVKDNRLSKVGGLDATLAGQVRVEADRGHVEVIANDDVALEGERVRLNC